MEEHYYELTSHIMKDNENDNTSDDETQEDYAISLHVQDVDDDHELSSSPPPLPSRSSYEVH